MNEHGFFTMIGLCFLLMATICVLNIQESGKIFAYDTANFQAELELQNIADSALIEAAEKIRLQPDLLPQAIFLVQSSNQYNISVSNNYTSDLLKNISVEVYGERGKIYQGTRKYKSVGPPEDKIDQYKDQDGKNKDVKDEGIILISVASCDGKIFEGKIFRRSFAYILDDNIIHYMNSD